MCDACQTFSTVRGNLAARQGFSAASRVNLIAFTVKLLSFRFVCKCMNEAHEKFNVEDVNRLGKKRREKRFVVKLISWSCPRIRENCGDTIAWQSQIRRYNSQLKVNSRNCPLNLHTIGRSNFDAPFWYIR